MSVCLCVHTVTDQLVSQLLKQVAKDGSPSLQQNARQVGLPAVHACATQLAAQHQLLARLHYLPELHTAVLACCGRNDHIAAHVCNSSCSGTSQPPLPMPAAQELLVTDYNDKPMTIAFAAEDRLTESLS